MLSAAASIDQSACFQVWVGHFWVGPDTLEQFAIHSKDNI